MSSIWTIRRSATDVKLTGLCGGVAQYWGVDPLLVRVGWALLALSGGIGLVLYLAGWLLIPVEGSDKALADDLFGESVRRWPRELWITLVVVASFVDVRHLRVCSAQSALGPQSSSQSFGTSASTKAAMTRQTKPRLHQLMSPWGRHSRPNPSSSDIPVRRRLSPKPPRRGNAESRSTSVRYPLRVGPLLRRLMTGQVLRQSTCLSGRQIQSPLSTTRF